MYRKRIEALQEKMKKEGLDYFLFSDADGHFSEYVSEYFRLRTAFSGFTGSNGILLVGIDEAYLWTDGRYFIQAEKELAQSGIELMRMGEKNVPGIVEYLCSVNMHKVIGIDSDYLSYQIFMQLKQHLAACVKIKLLKDYARSCLLDMDVIPQLKEWKVKPIKVLNSIYYDVSAKEKIENVRKELLSNGYNAYFSGKLDANMWLCNIRGNDIAYCPVAFSYVYVSLEEVILFVKKDAITPELQEHCYKNEIRLEMYERMEEIIFPLISNCRVASLYSFLNAYVACKFEENKITWIDSDCGVSVSQAIKTSSEIKALKEIYRKDSAAVCKFLYWLLQQKTENVTEYDAACKMNLLRAEIPEFNELSFDTIAAYASNAAMMHYSPSKNNPIYLKGNNLFLLDCGGQYEGGTTDVTRTVAIGMCSDEIKGDYTAVVKGMLALQNAHFLYGCNGTNLDILARAPIWERNLDYKCGTGHGIGFMLNVHEGPHSIRTKSVLANADTVIKEGMLVSDEPGIYKAGKYGIRIENILCCKTACESVDGTFMEFEVLTYVPLDFGLIVFSQLSEKEKEWVFSYQTKVCEVMKPYLSDDEYKWLCEYAGILKV